MMKLTTATTHVGVNSKERDSPVLSPAAPPPAIAIATTPRDDGVKLYKKKGAMLMDGVEAKNIL